jgi:hypothetical protein
MGIYLASVTTVMMAVFVPLFLVRMWSGTRDKDDTFMAVGATILLLFGTLTVIPMVWMAAMHEPKF